MWKLILALAVKVASWR